MKKEISRTEKFSKTSPLFGVALALILSACGEGGFQPTTAPQNGSIYTNPNGVPTFQNGQPQIGNPLPSPLQPTYQPGTGWCGNAGANVNAGVTFNAGINAGINPATGRPYTCVPVNPGLQAGLQFSIPTFQANYNPFWYLNANNAQYNSGCFSRDLVCKTQTVLVKCKNKRKGTKCKVVGRVCTPASTASTSSANTNSSNSSSTSSTKSICNNPAYKPATVVTQNPDGSISVTAYTGATATAPATTNSPTTVTGTPQTSTEKKPAEANVEAEAEVQIVKQVAITGDDAKALYDSLGVKPTTNNTGDLVKNGQNVVCTKRGETVTCEYMVNTTTGEVLANKNYDDKNLEDVSTPVYSGTNVEIKEQGKTATIKIPAGILESPIKNGMHVKDAEKGSSPQEFEVNVSTGSVLDNPNFKNAPKGSTEAPEVGLEDDTIKNDVKAPESKVEPEKKSDAELNPTPNVEKGKDDDVKSDKSGSKTKDQKAAEKQAAKEAKQAEKAAKKAEKEKKKQEKALQKQKGK